MSIRARLTIAIAIIFLVTIAVLGVGMVQSTRATLTNQLDEQVKDQAERRAKGPDPGKYENQRGPISPSYEDLSYELDDNQPDATNGSSNQGSPAANADNEEEGRAW